QKIYSDQYIPEAREAKPIKHYVKVDWQIPGCPADPKEINRILSALINDIEPQEITYPVCLECKAAGNPCFLKQGLPCLGPITRGGCNAICINNGIKCWGCRGLAKDANIEAMTDTLKSIGLNEQQIKKNYEVFWQEEKKLDKFFKGER
ncbi:unnamed protein product, partial [marine sediment metagenome]